MDAALPSFILGYHGCNATLADQVVAGQATLKHSTNDYDWLGDGIYFWEHNAQRAYDFAAAMAKRPHPSGQQIETPAVVGAVIDLGHCLNLLDSRYITLVREAHADLVANLKRVDAPIPVNRGGADLVDRKLDCAVLRFLHQSREANQELEFDTVRAAFSEGIELYSNAGFAADTHLQIAVRNPSRIVGYFHPRDDQGKRRTFS